MATQKRVGKGLCCVGGKYRRTLGKWVNGKGKVAAKRFLLGRDRRKAEMANLRLEQLWEVVVEDHERQERHRRQSYPLSPTGPVPREAVWEDWPLDVAKAIRLHKQVILVGQVDEEHTDAAYASRLHWLNKTYGHVMRFISAMPESLALGQQEHAHWAQHRARQASHNAAIANSPVPSTVGRQGLVLAVN